MDSNRNLQAGRFALLAGLAATALIAQGAGAQVVINQVYGAGGNTGALLRNDYVELYNKGAAAVDFAALGYSLQYANATSTTGFGATTVTNLTGTINPGGYYLVRFGSGGANGYQPAPGDADEVSTNFGTGTNLSATSGRLALASTTTALGQITGDATGQANIVDFVGYGTTATAREGGGAASSTAFNAPAAADASSDIGRTGFADTNNNSVDFKSFKPFTLHNKAGGALVPAPPSLLAAGLGSLLMSGQTLLRRRRKSA